LAAAAGLSARAVLVLGCRRGAFPPAPRPEALLRDPERIAVNRALRRAALATSGARRDEAAHLAFCALAAARETLALVWPAENGVPLAPLAAEALAAAGAVPEALAADPPLSRARAPAEALRAAARLGRDGRGGEAVAALGGAPALAARARQALAVGALERARREAVLARTAAPAAGLVPPALGGALAAALPDEWTPSQLEADARCPYRFFLAEVAGLAEPEAVGPDPDPRDEGSLVHAALERFVAGRRARAAWPLSGDAADRAEARAAAEAVMERFQAEGRVGDPRVWAARREAVLARIDRFVAAEARIGDGLAPHLLEHRFGGASGRPPLSLRDGAEEVRLAGRIDRVDAGGERVLVLDYKNARSRRELAARLEPEALGVTSFQAPLYLMAAARELPGRSRLAAGYALLRSGERTATLEVAAGDGLLALDEARRAEARAAGGRPVADAVLSAVRRIRGGEFPIASRDCAGCGFGAVCRFQSAAEAEP
ncbi:MAG TPA: PD-(D/E)XK nuclease family protein, partial [Anaeromyxobacteraceae bacterium]|nr:PD-(D/E)XK nuclease family protein [Anaeromyxobacteraceae bacterium]